MFARLLGLSFIALILFWTTTTEGAQDKKKRRMGTVSGVIKSSMPAPNKINQLIEVLADGEEKERKYRVVYDPTVKGPNKKVLEAVKAAKVGDRVRLEWIEGEGYNITAFEVLKKKNEEKKEKDK